MKLKYKIKLREIQNSLDEIQKAMDKLPRRLTSHFILDFDDMQNMVKVLLEDDKDSE